MSLKKTFSADKKKCTVTFTVKASEEAKDATTVTLAGDFNSWSSTDTPMKKNKDGFSVKLDLDAEKEYQFRYLFDGSRWENDWHADKYVPAPYSNADNSVVETYNK